MKKTVENETGNIRIEQIAKMEADTIGQVLIKDTDFVPLKKDESATTYQNLISGNDRKTNREGYVQFERRVRDIVEKCVRLMIPGEQSLFAAGQNDSNIKKFFQDSRKGFSYCTNSNGAVSDDETTATDWIHLLSSSEYVELPESLSEKYFTEQVFVDFASLLLLRLQHHRQEEGREELLKLAEEYCPLIRLPWIHLTDYCNEIKTLLYNPSDLTNGKRSYCAVNIAIPEFVMMLFGMRSKYSVHRNVCVSSKMRLHRIPIVFLIHLNGKALQGCFISCA